ncbi:MAG TPA: hypothetical protein VMR25_22630, partial [Planctomycetaceae bacterium]|nr:hypothetical protein [Planctomycetaceae bacterium]
GVDILLKPRGLLKDRPLIRRSGEFFGVFWGAKKGAAPQKTRKRELFTVAVKLIVNESQRMSTIECGQARCSPDKTCL